MGASKPRASDPDDFRERYAEPVTDVARRFERKLFGDERGRSGYLTTAQAERLGDLLQAGSGTRILELGAGRGSLGIHIAASTGARVVLSDVPFDALRSAADYAHRGGVTARMSAVCVDASMLPFAPRSFDAVVHSDVFC